MSNFDRHTAINGAWIAALAIGAIMMAAPKYFDLSRQESGLIFWVGVCALCCSIIALLLEWHSEKGEKKKMWGPFGVIAVGICITCAGAAWYFWPANNKPMAIEGRPLSSLSNEQLRQKALSFVNSIRQFEQSHNNDVRSLRASMQIEVRHATDSEDKNRILAHYNSIEQSDRERYITEFMSKYRIDAALLRDELEYRIGHLPDLPSTSPLGNINNEVGRQLFEGPGLAGVDPLSAGAGLLEYWAKQLPEDGANQAGE